MNKDNEEPRIYNIIGESRRLKKRDINVVGQSATVEKTKQSEKSYKMTILFLAFRIMSNNRKSRRIDPQSIFQTEGFQEKSDSITVQRVLLRYDFQRFRPMALTIKYRLISRVKPHDISKFTIMLELYYVRPAQSAT
uniref:Uncharacterized protein n=1 Tax=Romanomermis culicivorax TaxID=13658 RepID=A0A915J5T0_ROMCU